MRPMKTFKERLGNMEVVLVRAVYRIIALTHDLHIPRGWVILSLALLAWGLVFLGWLGIASLLRLLAAPS